MPSFADAIADLDRRMSALEARASASLRFGRVTGTEGGKARVEMTDGGKTVSHTLPTVQRRVLKDQDIKMPDPGEPVAVLFSGEGAEDGIVLGATYSPQAVDPAQEQQVEYSRFEDGTVISYDRKAHRLYANVKGDIEVINTGNITVTTDGDASLTAKGSVDVKADGDITAASGTLMLLKAPHIFLDGAVTLGGVDGAPGEAVLNGSMTVRNGSVTVPEGDVTAGSVALRGHQHLNSGGSGTGGTPVGG